MQAMTVAHAMSTALITVEMDFTLDVIEQIMIKRHIGHVLVVDQSKLVGIISDSDVKKQISPRSHSDLATTAEQRLLFIKAHQFRHYLFWPNSKLYRSIDCCFARENQTGYKA